MIRVLVAAYSGLTADAYATVLEGQEDLTVVGPANTQQAVEVLLPHCDVLLITPELQNGSVLELLRLTRTNHPAVKTIVTGVDEDAEVLQRYVQAGAYAYVVGREPVENVMLKLRAAREDGGGRLA